MTFYLIGIDHNSGSIDERETVHKKKPIIADFLRNRLFGRAAILATCNRVEIYGLAESIREADEYAELIGQNFPELRIGYHISGERNVFRHALRIAVGVESQLMGEAQILRQVDSWRAQGDMPEPLAALWAGAIERARFIRSQAQPKYVAKNIADIIFDDLSAIDGIPAEPRITIIGTGKIAELFAVKRPRARIDFIANKNHRKAGELAKSIGGRALSFEGLWQSLKNADVLISATKSPHFVVRKDDITRALSGRTKKLYIYDVAMPRDVEPAVSGVNGVVLKNIDGLSDAIERHNSHMKEYVRLAEYLIEDAVKKIKIGIRPSILALKQAEEIGRLLPSAEFEIVKIATAGDKDKDTPLAGMEGTDFFTREIEDALAGGRIDAAVHSAKDLEETQPAGLEIAAITRSISPDECLVSRDGKRLKELPSGARIGTSSQKRKAAILRYRPDLVVKDIRGNIDERLGKLDAGSYDAIVIAHAALVRLGYEDRIAEIIHGDIMEPHPMQGSLAIEVRADDENMKKLFAKLDTRKNEKDELARN